MGAAMSAFLQWRATRAQTKATLFRERHEAFRESGQAAPHYAAMAEAAKEVRKQVEELDTIFAHALDQTKST